MSAERFRRLIGKTKTLKKRLRNTSLYYYLRDRLFLKEQKKEKRIEKKYGLAGMIKYCKKWYKSATGFQLDLDNPKTFTEKQQWLKFFDKNNKIKTVCSDKYLVRDFIKNTIGEDYLVPLISIDGTDFFENANLINFDKLPNQFVLSCNHGSSMTIVVDDKASLTRRKIKTIKKQLNRWLQIDISYVNAFDFVYKGIKPGIIITKYLQDKSGSLNDYKVLCLNGKPKYIWIDSDRFTGHKRATYDLEFNKQPFNFNRYPVSDHDKPVNFDKMISLAKKMCANFKLLRVDFYNIDGKIYFGELTFNTGAGKELIYPLEYNEIIGNQLVVQ